MATLEKIRNKAGLLVLVVGVALFAFIIGDFLNSGSTYFRQSQERIAEINGTNVHYQDYQQRIDGMAEMYKMQMGTNTLPEESMVQIRQMVFNNMVEEIVLGEATSELGMTVCPDELFDMVQGENISPLIQQLPMFTNQQTGQFDKVALLNFLKAIDDDNIASVPADQQAQFLQAKNFWLFWERNIKNQRLEQKYATLISKAVSANKIDAEEAFNETSESSDIVYVMQSYSTIPDSTIEVSNDEIRKLYNQRKESFKQKESRVLKYISVDIRPSQEDYDNVENDIDALKSEFTTSDNVADLVNENSDVPYVNAFLSSKSLDAEMNQFVTNASIGEVYGPVFEDDRYRMFKLVDKTQAPDSVKVFHIMLAGRTDAEIETLADSLNTVLKNGGDFAQLAKDYSVDQSAENGGELGWFTELTALNGINEDFKNTIFSAKLNEVYVVKSMYGTHLVKVTEKTPNVAKYKVADIEMQVSPSSKTYSKIYNDLNQFIAKNQDVNKLEDAAKEAGYNIVTNQTVTADNQMLGMLKNSRPVIRWAFQNDAGKISEIFECDDKFVIAAIDASLDEGYRPIGMVASSLKSEIIAQKKGEQIVRELSAKNLTTLESYAEAMGANIDTVKFVNFDTRRISGIGVEPVLNAAVSMAEVNQVSTPVKGNNGVYVFKVYARNKENNEYDEANQIRTIDAANVYRLSYQSIQSLINSADIKDNRIRFY